MAWEESFVFLSLEIHLMYDLMQQYTEIAATIDTDGDHNKMLK